MKPVEILFYVTMYISLFVSIFWLSVVFNPDKKRNARKPPSEPVTIIVPAYNKASTIKKCLISLTNQNYPLNIIVIDDGSTDNTGKIVKKIAEKHENITYIRKENGGKATALNTGLEHVKTKY